MAIRLKNWSIFQRESSGFQPPELGAFCLQGNAYGYPRFNNGTLVGTSEIMRISDMGEYKEAITHSGSVYQLYKEDINPMAEKKFPNYYERLEVAE